MQKIDESIEATYGGAWIQQTWTGLFMLEVVLTKYKPGVIIELGTGYGSLSRFFAMFAPVVTFDIDYIKRIKEYPNITYYDLDVFCKKAQKIITELIESKRRVFLFCDGGDKGNEMNMYAPMLKKGDLLFAHDWKSAVHIGHITDMIVKLRPNPVAEQIQFDELKSRLVGFIMQ